MQESQKGELGRSNEGATRESPPLVITLDAPFPIHPEIGRKNLELAISESMHVCVCVCVSLCASLSVCVS